MPTSKSQQFSQVVFERVTAQVERLGQDDASLRKYKSLCKRSGGMLRTVGLIQYLTFLEARGNRELQHHMLLDDLRESLGQLHLIELVCERDALLQMIRCLPLPRYMHLTREVLRLLDWHKRLADILIEGTADEHTEED